MSGQLTGCCWTRIGRGRGPRLGFPFQELDAILDRPQGFNFSCLAGRFLGGISEWPPDVACPIITVVVATGFHRLGEARIRPPMLVLATLLLRSLQPVSQPPQFGDLVAVGARLAPDW